MFRIVPCWHLGAGSDQFHEEIGTSTVGGFGLLIRSTTESQFLRRLENSTKVSRTESSRRFTLENSTKVSRTESPCRNVRNKISDGGGDGGGGGEERRGREKIIS
ncbi:hypothetical protein F511_22452 [Dorcoceras hygrometricum]|uniref:Uncharacterized protein n=1 Tax=Dorcoceras hygrometricum TaxID=472368 RepID=A0A2Z7AQQ5_9LAMI|nr:hypothetical protein F511_22452 [Dorcoceras hygrometricum]